MEYYAPITEYTAVDIETPGTGKGALCSIGLVHVKYGKIIETAEHLVNPEADFTEFCVGIHHITPGIVANAPTFYELWPNIAHFFTGKPLVAHNAQFDISIISAALVRYGIEFPPMSYVCTCRLARKHVDREQVQNHRLNTLCAKFDIQLINHHNALADALAAQELFEILSDKFGSDERDVKTYLAKKTTRKRTAISKNLIIEA